MASHAEKVLSAILSTNNPRRDLLATAVVRLEPEHFVFEAHKIIFQFLERYYDRTGEVATVEAFAQKLESMGVEAAKVLAYTQTFAALADTDTTEADFKWGCQELREEHARRATGTAITEAMEILERGYEVGRDFYKGHEDARKFLSAKVTEIDRLGAAESAPEGDIFSDVESIWADYVARRDGELGQGVRTGIRVIDDQTGGVQRGEMVLICAYAGQGKSQLSTQMAWHAAVEQGKNVFFATSETVRDQVIRRILARHSRLPQFECPDGLNSSDIKRGLLTAEQEQILGRVLADWREGQHTGQYGKLNVVQVPRHATLSYVENRLKEYGRDNDCELCVVDYLALLKPEVKRGNEREEFNEILRNAKLMATGYNDGQGIPLVSPWQIRRDSHTDALRNGYYTLGALSDTSEAEKSADQIVALLRDQDNAREMRLQFLKMRDDILPPIQEVAIDFRSTYIGNQSAMQSLAPSGGNNDLMSMLLNA